ncbi:hypothetical protein [Corallococcus exercitus]|uniref:Uncharacterized protein n=1 Tax=Corallococcus exercitus TaxID=2316736 RepID=A0A7Y4KGF2_9BACT|nr:hypothetical protein [Corallococcus exercitus]NOK32239.1 hypothetical protein [Corallococcus exercitus]
MAKKNYTPDEMRGNVKNPNSAEYAADRANRAEQGHPNVPPPPPAQSEGDKK